MKKRLLVLTSAVTLAVGSNIAAPTTAMASDHCTIDVGCDAQERVADCVHWFIDSVVLNVPTQYYCK